MNLPLYLSENRKGLQIGLMVIMVLIAILGLLFADTDALIGVLPFVLVAIGIKHHLNTGGALYFINIIAAFMLLINFGENGALIDIIVWASALVIMNLPEPAKTA